MSASVTKADAYLINGPGADQAIAAKVTAYLVIDTNTVVDAGDVPVIFRQVDWNATLARGQVFD